MSNDGNLKSRDSPFLHVMAKERFNIANLGLWCFGLDLRPRHAHKGEHQQTTKNQPQQDKREYVRQRSLS